MNKRYQAHRATPLRIAIPLLVFCFAGLLLAVAACSGEDPQGTASSSGTTASSSGQGGEGGVLLNTGGDMTTTASGGFGGECASSSNAALPMPVTMFITFDRSASMKGDKWNQSTDALQAFFEDPKSAGLKVTMRFFPHDGCGDNQSCDVAPCSKPLVPLGELSADPAPADGHEASLLNAMAAIQPNGGTPMSVALEGAEKWAINRANEHTDELVVVVLVTDGSPSACNLNASYLTGLASGALKSANVLTFPIGLKGSDVTLLDAIAAAGGTDKAQVVDDMNGQAELLKALQDIQVSSVACSFTVPESDGMPTDPTKVNVHFKPGDGGDPILIKQVASKSKCTDKGGWYYDDPMDPKTILFCPATCVSVQGDADATVDIVLGCETVTEVPT